MAEAKNCSVHLWNELGLDLDLGMLEVVMKRCARHALEAAEINIYPQERIPLDAPDWKHPGYLEWVLRVKYRSGSEMTVGCIQRKPGDIYEFHS